MGRFIAILLVLILLLLIGGAVFLAFWEFPAPSQPMEIILPNEQSQ